MGLVTGNNLTIFAGDDMNVIGCEESCTVTVTTEEIITTTKASGRGTNREYGRYDATLSASGVVFIYATESSAAAANRQDPTYFHSYILQGKKVCAKYQFADGAITKYVIANWIVRSCVFTGQTDDYATFDIELALDGQLYESASMKSDSFYDGPSIFIYKATSTTSTITDSVFVGISRIYFLVKNSVLNPNITIVPGGGIPIDPDQVEFNPSTGDIYFGTNLVDGDIVLISYEPTD